jgi:diguanylate cyclase (GGDEF)-like protein
MLIVIIASLSSGAATILASHKVAAVGYSFTILVPFSLTMAFTDETSIRIMGLLGLCYFLVMLFSTMKLSNFTKQAILWKNENALLVNSMEEEVAIRARKIYELSNIDPLTEIYNRNAFLLKLEQELSNNSDDEFNFALLFIDLDGFKKINDSLGHEIGDSILKSTASRLHARTPDDSLLCRWGGDEFLMVIPFTEQKAVIKFADNIIKTLSAPHLGNDNRLHLSATIGIALYPYHTTNISQLIQWADMAMYNQKKINPSSVGLFDDALRKKVFHEMYLKDALTEAINKHQLFMVFQPIVNAKSHHLIAFEALMRWRLDDKIIPPTEFIPIAEQYGQINKIGEWILRQSCLVATAWPEHIAVSVNVSVMQLQEDDFIETVESAIIESGLAPRRLHIEITESVFAQDKNSIIDRVKSLQERGVAVSIDDFGTEYSSLSIIQDLSANVVKIDKAFIDNLETTGFAIVKAILHIASALNYQVIAEGVENKSQADILLELGVDSLQGYYFSKPLILADANKFITTDNKRRKAAINKIA